MKKSFVLPMVLFIIAVMVMIGFYLVEGITSEARISTAANAGVKCFDLAEAGIQEATYKVQYDSTARDTFLNTTNGLTTIPLKSALLDHGSYSVTIQNTAKAAATITSTGYYQVSDKQAQRKITLKIIQASVPGSYDLDAALFVGGSNPGNISITNANISHDSGYDPSSMIGGANISFKNASVNMTKDIRAVGDITNQNSNITYGGAFVENDPTTYNMPMIDVTSDCAVNANSYKCLAQSESHYYTSAQFNQLISNTTTLNGIIYVAGDSGIILKNKTLTVNGILVSEGSISLTNANFYINHTATGPSGLITLKNFNITNANVAIQGLVYIGIQSSMSTNANVTVTGAILAHQFSATNINLTLDFKKDWVNEAIQPNVSSSPIIQLQHWEEEY